MLEARVDRVRRTATVHEDWVAWLPEAKDHLFAFTNQELEASYISLSVTLDDTFSLCQQGRFPQAREQAANFADLADRLAGGLRAVLRSMHEHGQQFGTVPNFAPLRSDYFRSDRAKQIARTNNLFSFLILRSRKRFFPQTGRRRTGCGRSSSRGSGSGATDFGSDRAAGGQSLEMPRSPALRSEHLPARDDDHAQIIFLRPAIS